MGLLIKCYILKLNIKKVGSSKIMMLGLILVPFIIIVDIILFIRALKYNNKKHSIITTIIHCCLFIGCSIISAIVIANSWYYFNEDLYNTLSNISGYSIMFGGIILSLVWFVITIIKQKQLKNVVKEEKQMKKEIKEETKATNNEITLKINSKTLIVIGGAIMGIIIIILLIILIFKGNGGSGATHGRTTLNDSNINQYITVELSGRLTDYQKYSRYKGVYLTGKISSSLVGSQCENVSFDLEMTAYYKTESYSSTSRYDTFTKKVYLDSGCNFSIGQTEKLSLSAHSDTVSYSYDIKNVSGSIIIPKTIIE